MTSVLDSRDTIKQLDKSKLLDSVEALADQMLDALKQTRELAIPAEYKTVKHVIVAGMGGSSLGSYVIKELFRQELTIPFEIAAHYTLPAYTGVDTLVVLSSYSGTTEETLSCAQDAINKHAKVMVMCAGGTLAQKAREHKWPLYGIKATYNPSPQPRMAIGYAIVGQLAMLTAAGILSDQRDHLVQTAQRLKNMITGLAPESVSSPAKLLAFSAYDKHTIFVAGEHLIGAAHLINNQFNENAKCLTSEWHLPEFNHHYMEALSFPKLAKETTMFFLFNSPLYHERVQKRVILTKELLEQKGFEVQLIQATAPTKLEQVFEIIQLGEYVAAYLPLLYQIPNPGPVPNVEWFKTQMAK